VVGHASGPPLGVSDSVEYVEERASLSASDLIVVVTDGLLEAIETNLFAMSVLKELVARAPQEADLAGCSIVHSLDRPAAKHSTDDVTLMCVEMIGDDDGGPRSRAGAGSCAFSS
jgi:serine phosphatase RsbU (regulator of sigma subunit)